MGWIALTARGWEVFEELDAIGPWSRPSLRSVDMSGAVETSSGLRLQPNGRDKREDEQRGGGRGRAHAGVRLEPSRPRRTSLRRSRGLRQMPRGRGVERFLQMGLGQAYDVSARPALSSRLRHCGRTRADAAARQGLPVRNPILAQRGGRHLRQSTPLRARSRSDPLLRNGVGPGADAQQQMRSADGPDARHAGSTPWGPRVIEDDRAAGLAPPPLLLRGDGRRWRGGPLATEGGTRRTSGNVDHCNRAGRPSWRMGLRRMSRHAKRVTCGGVDRRLAHLRDRDLCRNRAHDSRVSLLGLRSGPVPGAPGASPSQDTHGGRRRPVPSLPHGRPCAPGGCGLGCRSASLRGVQNQRPTACRSQPLRPEHAGMTPTYEIQWRGDASRSQRSARRTARRSSPSQARGVIARGS